MDEKKVTKLIYAAIAFTVLMLCLVGLFQFLRVSDILERFFSYRFNSPERVNVLVDNQLRKLAILGFLAVVLLLGIKNYRISPIRKLISRIEGILFKILSFRFLFVTIVVYLLVLFFLAVSRYDLGVDEAIYPLYAGHFWESGSAYSIYNAQIYIVDNFTMLPMYLASAVNFAFNLTDVWHFKLLSSLLSLVSLVIISKIALRAYNYGVAVLFTFFLVIQPGFGFVASSFFGEIVQAAFFFPAAYIWLKDDSPPDKKKILLVSLLFAISIQTKFQQSQALVLTLFFYHFLDNKRKAFSVLLLTISIVAALSIVRLIPALVYHKYSLLTYMRFWADQFIKYTAGDFFYYIDRAGFFDRFLPVIFLPLILAGIFMWTRTGMEKFLSLFTLFFFLWWVLYFKFTNYRVLFIGIIPFCYLLAAFAYDFYHKILDSGKSSRRALVYISSACIFTLLVYGYSQNLIYAAIGNNDAVQFDLDEYRSRLFTPIRQDNSQKKFYEEAGIILQNADSIYFPASGMPAFTPQFYLGESRIFDYEYLINSLNNSAGRRYVIIDRTAFPLGLENGYRTIDSLGVNRNLILKKGEYELYSVFK